MSIIRTTVPGQIRTWCSRLLLLGSLLMLAQVGVQAQTPPDLTTLKAAWWAEHLLEPFPPATEVMVLSSTETLLTPAQAENYWGTVFQKFEEENWEIRLQEGWQPSQRLASHPAADVYPRLTIGGTQIAFASERDGNFEIYTMGLAGENLTRLTFDDALDTMPVWSPDGKQLVFVSERRGNADLYRINADGSDLILLTTNNVPDLFPHWSPDGSSVVWVQQNGRNGTLWVMNADGSEARPLSGPHRFAARPVWSPDGSSIAFDADFDGDGLNQLGLINADGSGLQVLTTGQDMSDHWMGSWNILGYEIQFSRIHWAVEDNELQFRNARLYTFCFILNEICGPFGDDLFAINPDRQSLDILPPNSQLDPLPAYSHQANFYLTGQITDPGRAGLEDFKIQYRQAEEIAWTDVGLWMESIGLSNIPFQAPLESFPIGEYFFRVAAKDRAGNQEAWPADERGQASTKLFTSLLAGRLTDPRGRPLVRLAVSIEPAPWENAVTDHNGEFQAHLRSADLHTFQDNIQFPGNRDRYFNDYLVPSGNLIQNYDFEEAGNAAWHLSGEAQFLTDKNLAHSGNNSINVGKRCRDACLATVPLPAEHFSELYRAQIESDVAGNLHLLASRGRSLLHQMRTVDGLWQPYTIFSNNSEFYSHDIALGEDGSIHVVWAEPTGNVQDGILYHAQRNAAGEWQTPVPFGRGIEPKIASDTSGTLHVVSRWKAGFNAEPIEMRYWQRAVTGVWSAHEVIAASSTIYQYELTTIDTTLHLLWSWHSSESNLSELVHRRRNEQGQWSTPILIRSSQYLGGIAPYATLNLQVDSQHRLHLFWHDNSAQQNYYSMWRANGGWSAKESVPPPADYFAQIHQRLFLDSADRPILLMAMSVGWPESTIVLQTQTRTPQGGWSLSTPQTFVDGLDRDITQLHLTKTGDFFVVASLRMPLAVQLYQSQPDAEPTIGHAAQSVTLPADMHRPTLSFLHNLVGELDATNGLSVTVTDALTTTLVYSRHQESAWGLGWADLTEWRGQTITVTFSFESAAEPFSEASLDKISLAAWRTPVATAINPARIESGVATKVLIYGENFLDRPIVALGDQPLAGVRWISANQLEVDLPATLQPVVYEVWITNPGEQVATLAGSLAVGEQHYLPLVGAAGN